jgi:redox-sensitive bicupin YhaK (pirin superfamily)
MNQDIPETDLPDGAGKIRVIAGEYLNHQGPAATFTPINLWDIRLVAGHKTEFQVPAGHTTALFVLNGEIKLDDGSLVREAEIAVLDSEGDQFSLNATKDAKILFLGGEPIHEPIVGYGPFVMNTTAEIQQAFADFQSGKMGGL